MEDVRQKYINGTITKIMYKKLAIEKTFQILHSSGYSFVNTLGSGTFGTVIQVKEQKSSSPVALKIVLDEDASNGEKFIWPHLQHTNILRLQSQHFLESTRTFVFKMPVHPFTLNDLLCDSKFKMDFRALPRAKFWLEGIISGLRYLHSTNCYHLDVKWNNILISAAGNAVICDFTFLTQTEDFVTK